MLAGCGSDPPTQTDASSDTDATTTGRDDDTAEGDDDHNAEGGSESSGPNLGDCEAPPSGTLAWSAIPMMSIPHDISLDADGSMYVAEKCLSKWDEPGQLRWEADDFPSSACLAVDVDPPSGDVTLVGWVPDDFDFRHAHLARYDENGKAKWSYIVDEFPFQSEEAVDVEALAGGHFLWAGRRRPGDGSVVPWVQRRDADGGLIWGAELEGEFVDVYPEHEISLAANEVGFLLVVGTVRMIASAGAEVVVVEAFYVDGGHAWSWLSPVLNELRGVAISADNHVAVAGKTGLVMLDPAGVVVWERYEPWIETVYALEFDPCGAIVLAGAGRPDVGAWGDAWIMKVDLEGEPIWTQFVPAPIPDRLENRFDGVEVDAAGNVFAVGGVAIDQVMEDDGYETIVEPWLGRFEP